MNREYWLGVIKDAERTIEDRENDISRYLPLAFPLGTMVKSPEGVVREVRGWYGHSLIVVDGGRLLYQPYNAAEIVTEPAAEPEEASDE